jgi:hypothetical protein
MFGLNDKKYKIKTPNGWEDFRGVRKIIKKGYLFLNFGDGTNLKCSAEHKLFSNESFIEVVNLNIGDFVETQNGKTILLEKIYFNDEIELYDIVDSGVDKCYYSNGVLSHNCEFIGSSATLIPASKLRTLAFKNPKRTFDDIDVYREPEEKHIYVITVDCAEGVGQDFSAFSVFDVTELPYRQVAKYKNNNISPLLYPTMIYNAARKYNNSYVLVETNNIGQQVVDILHYDLEYENIFTLEHHNIKGQHISAGFKKSVSFGLKTTKSVKKIGCANLKTLIENDKLLIEDFDTISELNTFVRIKDSYEAEEGNNDDVVMTLVFFSWLTAQSYFKQITDSDVRKTLSDDHNLMLEEDMSPVGFFDENIYRQETFREGDDMWSIVEDRGYKTSTL